MTNANANAIADRLNESGICICHPGACDEVKLPPYTIKAVIYSEHLIGDVMDASALHDAGEAYRDEVEDAVREMYPDATLDISVQHGVSGAGTGVWVDDQDWGPVVDAVGDIMEHVHEHGSWLDDEMADGEAL